MLWQFQLNSEGLSIDMRVWASQVAQWQRICLPNIRLGFAPGWGRSPGEGNGLTVKLCFCICFDGQHMAH